MEAPQTLAMGSGVLAGQLGSAATLQNPSNMPLTALYMIDAVSGYDSGLNQFTAGGVVTDSVTSSLSAGVGFRGVLGPKDDTYRGMDGQLALALALFEELALSVTGRYVLLQDKQGDGDENVQRQPEVTGFTMDASVRLTPLPGLNFVGLAYNFIDRNSTLAPRRFGGSAAYRFNQNFVLGGDLLADIDSFEQTEYITGGGMELMLGGVMPLRMGYRLDTGREAHAVTGGLGYLTPAFSVDFGLRQDLNTTKDTRVLVSMAYRVR